MPLMPKTITLTMPDYYGVFYVDAGIQSALRTLESTAKVMHDAGNSHAYFGLCEAIACFKAFSLTVNEIKAANTQELQSQNAPQEPEVSFGITIEDDDDDNSRGPLRDS